MSSYVVGDIHGHNQLLQKLLQKITLKDEDTIIFVGDYIDRGSDSKGVVDTILELKAHHSKTVCLKGNHEQWMMQSHLDDTKNSWIMGMDGCSTIESYSPELVKNFKSILKESGMKILTEKKAYIPYDMFFLQTMPKEHLAFFNDLELYYEDENIICSHAGLDVDAALEVQEEIDLLWGSPEKMIYEWRGSKTLVMGHENTCRVDAKMWGQPIIKEKVVLLDTGPSFTGVLTAVRFPDRAIFQSKL